MNILMLGWEFPPHISGGLGSACQAIVQGLRGHDVDVTFVLPKAFGDEHHASATILGCNTFVGTPGATNHAASPRDDRRGGICEIPVASALVSPYLDAAAYERARAELPEAPVLADHEAQERLRILRDRLLADDADRNALIRDLLAGIDPDAFTGRYGQDLQREVARYALVVAAIALTRDFDVIHAHDWMTWPAAIAAAALTGKPWVAHVHATELNRSPHGYGDRRISDIESRALAVADRVVAVSGFLRDQIVEHYHVEPERVRVVHNGAPTFDVSGQPARRTVHDPVVLMLGRVTWQKGPRYFLEAARRVVARIPEARFVVAGSGDLLPSMIEQAAEMGIGDRVHFTGFLGAADVRRMYDIADVYVMPSVSEPFGIAPLEAMARGRPVVISRQSGVSEVIEGAMVVDYWDVDAMAQSIATILTTPALRDWMIETGRADVARLTWDLQTARIVDVYNEVAP